MMGFVDMVLESLHRGKLPHFIMLLLADLAINTQMLLNKVLAFYIFKIKVKGRIAEGMLILCQ